MTEAAYSTVASGESAASRGGFGAVLAFALSAVGLAALTVAGQATLLRLAIPGAAVLVGLVLYFSQPVRYIEYSLWLWFLTPLVRRLVDWRFGFAEPNMVLLAPLLVSGISVLTLVRPKTRANARPPGAFVLCGAAIFYGFAIGMIAHRNAVSPAEMVYGLANWLCPLLLGLHTYMNWPAYDAHRRAITRTFLFGVLFLGVYGVYQFFAPPPWDLYWLERVVELDPLGATFGKPEPFLIRVWSTMNSPGPFANVMIAGLLLFFGMRSRWKVPAAIAGYLSLLLSMVRTAWLSWFVGFVLILAKTKSRMLVRTLLSVMAIALCLLPFLADPRVAPLVKDRIQTFTDLGHDDSFGSRADMYSELIEQSIENPAGFGLSNQTVWQNTPIDSGIISMLFSLGWLGTLLFAAGILSGFLALRAGPGTDPFAVAGRAIAVAILAQIVGGNTFVGINAVIFWMFVGMGLSGNRAYEAEYARHPARYANEELSLA